MLPPDYYNNYNGLAATQRSKDFLITYCLTLTFIMLCAFPLFTDIKDSIFWTLQHILDNTQGIRLYTVHIFNTLFRLYTILNKLWQLQIYDDQFQQPETQKVLTQVPPLLDEFITEVREQLTVFPSVVLTQVPPPLDEFITKVREQLTVLSSAERTPPIHKIQQECCELQVFEAEQFFSYTPHVYIGCTYAPPCL